MEQLIEKAMYATRWLMAPIYLGLSLALLALGIKFFQEVFHILPIIFNMKEVDLILVMFIHFVKRNSPVFPIGIADYLEVFFWSNFFNHFKKVEKSIYMS